MALHSPSDEFMQASAARVRLREKAEQRRLETRRNRFRWILYVFALLLLAALVADLRGISRRLGEFQRAGPAARKGDAADIAGGLGGARYVDPSGRFSVVPPRHWVRVAKPVHSFFNVVFQGPYGMDMSIQAVATNGVTFDKLVENLRRVERGLAADTHMDFAYVGPHRAVKRSAQLFKTKLLMLDFVTGDLAHHVQFSVPPALYDEYEPVFLRLMQTYEPGRLLPAPDAPAAP
ncbi:MAG: hypothetical protein EOM72_07055 [Opitutae bacterium]|nr:hypothetical protein [Opitutae bacterium]